MGKFGEPKSNKYCCVPQCKSRCTNEISLFFFPKDETLKKRWADAIKTEKRLTPHMQVCSRHFNKNDYILSDYPGTTKVRRLKRSAVPSQNLPWQFPNKRVSPTLAKARMERLKNRTQQKTSVRSRPKAEAKKHKYPENIKSSSDGNESDPHESTRDPFDKLLEHDKKETETTAVKEESNIEPIVKPSENEKTDVNVREGAPTRLRQRQGVLKCELCGRKCLTPQALRTHQQIAHKNIKNDLEDPVVSPAMSPTIVAKDPGAPTPVALITVKQPGKWDAKPAANVNDKSTTSKMSSLVEKVLLDDDTDYETDRSSDRDEFKPEKRQQTKVEFECPKCKKRFAVLFSAKKHIQKHHLGLDLSDDLQTELPKALKPIPIEICTLCTMQTLGNVHVCAGPLKLANTFICTGCKQEFKSLTLFDLHKSGMHSDGVESMFFPLLDEFENWKSKMQNQTRVTYTLLDQNDTKKIHRCTHVVHKGVGSRSRSIMCPSSIIVQEYAKGFQVHYYPNHHGHDSSDYGLSKAFSKYSIASLMNMTASQLPDSDDEDLKETDLYIQFQRLTELMVKDAARINVNTLKMLMRKTLEMIGILNNYNEDEDIMTFSEATDANDDLTGLVKEAFRSLKKHQHKRPSTVVPETSIAKRSKPVLESRENINAKPVKSNSAVVKIKEETIESVSEKKPVFEKTSQSFIDTFEQFVGKTRENTSAKRKPRAEAYPNGQRNVKKAIKTKIGQFKPSPKKNSLSPSSNQFSPSRSSIGSVKEIEYEVKEQENDCNILILKI